MSYIVGAIVILKYKIGGKYVAWTKKKEAKMENQE